ncbi:MAG: MFS transporter [Deltaproteobacteria bacterium]|nr:MFS transporter [Deltaproteobacteria bacterium]
MSEAGSKLRPGVSAAYAAGNFANSILPIVLLSWILYFYSAPEDAGRAVLLSPMVIGAIRGVERLFGAVIEPIVGHLCDRTNTRFGRRLPWIFFGAPLFCASFAAIWFPPGGMPTDSPVVVAYFTVTLVLFWASYTAVVGPYLALLPELVADGPGRVRLSIWLALFEALANVVGAVVAGMIISIPGAMLLGVHFKDGYEILGVVLGAVALAVYALMLAIVREPPRTPAHDIPFRFSEAIKTSLANPTFLPYAIGLAGYRAGSSAAVIGIPFVATQLMKASEEVAGYMLGVIIVFATVGFPVVQVLSNRFGVPKVFRWCGIGFVVVLPLIGTIGLFPVSPMVHGVILFVLAGFSVAGLMVLPRALLAEVIDIDHASTKLRREAMYNGMSGVVEKGGEALSLGVIGFLFERFGNSASSPLGLRLMGVAAGVFVVIGLFAFRGYEESARRARA